MSAVRQCDPAALIRRHRAELLAAFERVIDSGAYILGEEVAAFEREFAAHSGIDHAVGVGSGTDAIVLALRALGIGPGARVATVSHTAVATVAAIEIAGAMPVFVDIDPETYTMDPRALAELMAAAQPLHAVLAVHLYGHPADLPALSALASGRGIPLIEDCAQAHGAQIGGRFVGGAGDAAAFSFYPTKNVGAVGDAGVVATANEALGARVKMLRQYGWQDRISMAPGFNSRMDELQAAFLRVALAHLDTGNRRRAAIASAYDAGLERSGLTLPVQRRAVTHVYHQYVVRHRDRDGLRARLQPAYRDRCSAGPSGLAASEAAAREVMSLPMHPELSDEAVAQVIHAVNAVL